MHEQSLTHLLEVTQSLALKTPDSFQNCSENVVYLGKVVSSLDSRPVSVYNREELIPHGEIGIDGYNNSQSFQQMPKLHLEWLTWTENQLCWQKSAFQRQWWALLADRSGCQRAWQCSPKSNIRKGNCFIYTTHVLNNMQRGVKLKVEKILHSNPIQGFLHHGSPTR